MFERVRVRLTTLTVALFVVLYLLSSLSVYSIVRHTVMGNVGARMRTVAMAIDAQILQGMVPTVPAKGIYWFVPNALPSTNAPTSVVQGLRRLARTHSRARQWEFTWSVADATYRVRNLPVGAAGTGSPEIIVAADITQELAVLSPLRKIILIVGIIGAAIAGIAGFFWAGRALRPIRAAWSRQVQFVSDASHELRTPLAVIQSNLDLVLDHSHQTVEENLEWIDNAHSEARRLTRLVEDLLTLARSDAKTTAIRSNPVALSELLRHIGDLFEPIAAAKGITLRVDCPTDVTVSGDRDRLQQLFIILIDNACKYTDRGGRVEIGLTPPQRGTLSVRVSDTGSGIDDADLPRVFDRFYRADKARARGDAEGTGLGLSIAKWITEAHHGKIQLTSRPGEGTVVIVQLPA